MPRWAKSVLLTVPAIPRSERSAISPLACVGKLKTAKFLVAGRVAAAVRETTALEDIGPLVLKGLTQPVSVFNVLEDRSA